MRAIKGNPNAEGDKEKDKKELPDESIDPMDIKDGKAGQADASEVSSSSKIKSMVSSKGLVGVGMIGFVGWMMYSTFIKKPPKQFDENGNEIVQTEVDKNQPLSKVDIPKSAPGSIAQKSDDNPFKQISAKSKDSFGRDIALEDPDLPPLDLSKDAAYLDPAAPSLGDEKGTTKGGKTSDQQVALNNIQLPGDQADASKQMDQPTMEQMGIVGKIPPPGWINLSSQERQYNPDDPSEMYDPSTRILYRNGKKYLVDIPQAGNQPSMDVISSAGAGNGVINAGMPTDMGDSKGMVGAATSDTMQINSSVGGQITDERKLSMFVIEGGPPSSGGRKQGDGKKDFMIMDESLISERKTDDTKSSVKKLSNLDTSVLGGKIIDAVLETALNTQVPGNARAIVSHDVYGETGDKVLIPKGSRLYGTYSSNVTRGQSRIQISWSRIMRPDGIDVTISAQASDQFGRAGIRGDVDNRIGDSIANSIIMTMTTLGAGLLAQQLGTGQGQSQVVNPNGTFTTTNITPLNYAAQAAIQTATEMLSNLTEGSQTLAPIISLPQGTKIKIIMDQDVRLPPFKKIILP